MRLVAVRHGQTTLNAEGRYTGWLDPGLTAIGFEQAAALADVASSRAWARVLHSGTRRTAETLAGAFGVAPPAPARVVVDERLRERSFGVFDGAPHAAWTQPPELDAAPEGGESYISLAARVTAALDDHAVDGDVLLVAHSGVLRVLAALGGVAGDTAAMLAGGTANGGVLELDYAAPSTLPAFLMSS